MSVKEAHYTTIRCNELSNRMKTYNTLFLIAATILMLVVFSAAQERGQYVPGFRGLNPADQPGPGVTYANYFTWYPTTKLKDRDGRTAASTFDVDLVADVNVFAYTPKKKILGATYSASVSIPITNMAITLPRLGANVGGAGIGDIYVEPVSLGWTLKKGKVRAAYGFVAPTGRFREGADDNTTSDYWGHQITLGGTYNPDKFKLWQISASSVWELHHKKRHEDVTVGNNVTFEYGVGRTFVRKDGRQLYQFGVAGYAQFQLKNDSGIDVTPVNLREKDRVFALGPEFGIILPTKKMNFLVRVLPEFGARSRTQGVTLFVGFGKTF